MNINAQDDVKQQAIQLYEANEWEKLEELLQQHEAELQADPDFYLLSARVQTYHLHLDDSEAWLRRGVNQFPDNIPLKQGLAVILELKRQLSPDQRKERSEFDYD
ncbi:hypothetical protein GCM10025857_13870 [Alicyclobacillus contaminans]|uniref:hypothetical protein n=1 Tax=Alicyclobacillus contaminans TaxID=392016 RepID=UPI0003FD8779|nr:hypothetical protein [Alicyclobacillus contaminans]GMA50030.1 hypothetical protein GCM10025857_13870 [Alicyclobacillus contaminans]